MKNSSILDLVNFDELSVLEINTLTGGDTEPIVVDNGTTSIISLWMDTGIRN
ncbi:MAG: hypothetical protein IPM69_16975 [Ignavibacteria bacterium]|nr:hypothetical protein [Ignavibacteria bacterium]